MREKENDGENECSVLSRNKDSKKVTESQIKKVTERQSGSIRQWTSKLFRRVFLTYVDLTGSTAAVQQKKINDALIAYYEATTKAILGKEETVMKVALEDIRTNPRIGPLLPYFVNFISTGIKTLSHDVGQLKKLLHVAKALLRNRMLDLTPKPYLELMLAR